MPAPKKLTNLPDAIGAHVTKLVLKNGNVYANALRANEDEWGVVQLGEGLVNIPEAEISSVTVNGKTIEWDDSVKSFVEAMEEF